MPPFHDDEKPTVDDHDNIRDEWRSKDRVAKFLGIFSSKRLFADWEVAEPDESKRSKRRANILYRPCKNTTNQQKILHLRTTSSDLLHRKPMSHFRHFAIACIK